jgi:hypothetical protein
MANHYYGVTVPEIGIGGATTITVTKGTSTTSANVELVVLDGVTGNSKVELVKALKAITAFIETDDAPS